VRLDCAKGTRAFRAHGGKEAAVIRPHDRRARPRRLASVFLGLALLLILLIPGGASAAAGDLYAATGAGGGANFCTGTPSSLYTLDPSTGDATLVGPITIGGNQIRHVTGLAVKPNDGTLYAIAAGQQSDCSDFNQSTLMTVDPATGAATVVGTMGGVSGTFPDIAFDPFGTLYGWNEDGDDLYTISLVDGTSTKVGECDCSTFETGVAVDSHGTIYVKPSDLLWTVSHSTGQITSETVLSQAPKNILAFDPSDTLYTGDRTPEGFKLQTIDPSTGTVTDVGSNTVQFISAIAFDLGTFTEPPQADLSLTKAVDNPTPEIGTDIVFTLTLQNSGPDPATGVEVTDLLPGGYDYVSDDGGGAYDPTTGVWTVGSLASGTSATLHITAQPNGGLLLENTAEVTASDQFDPDSDPGDGVGDDFASVTTEPFNPGFDAAVSAIDVKGPTRATARKKGFTVTISNVGSDTITVNSGQLDAAINGNANLVECRSFSATLSSGESVRVRCTANIAGLGISPGDDVTYEATIDLPFDADSSNDTATLTVTAS
jgi:uncharacterized repeat protein (TIGR01451 family)